MMEVKTVAAQIGRMGYEIGIITVSKPFPGSGKVYLYGCPTVVYVHEGSAWLSRKTERGEFIPICGRVYGYSDLKGFIPYLPIPRLYAETMSGFSENLAAVTIQKAMIVREDR